MYSDLPCQGCSYHLWAEHSKTECVVCREMLKRAGQGGCLVKTWTHTDRHTPLPDIQVTALCS